MVLINSKMGMRKNIRNSQAEGKKKDGHIYHVACLIDNEEEDE